jgi:hypothetical protein
MIIYGNDRQKDFSCGFVKIYEDENPRIVRLRGSKQDCHARYTALFFPGRNAIIIEHLVAPADPGEVSC